MNNHIKFAALLLLSITTLMPAMHQETHVQASIFSRFFSSLAQTATKICPAISSIPWSAPRVWAPLAALVPVVTAGAWCISRWWRRPTQKTSVTEKPTSSSNATATTTTTATQPTGNSAAEKLTERLQKRWQDGTPKGLDQPHVQCISTADGEQVLKVGDLHGSLSSLQALVDHFKQSGDMTTSGRLAPGRYLVSTGDTAFGRVENCVPETFNLLLDIQVANPGRVFLIRGNMDETYQLGGHPVARQFPYAVYAAASRIEEIGNESKPYLRVMQFCHGGLPADTQKNDQLFQAVMDLLETLTPGQEGVKGTAIPMEVAKALECTDFYGSGRTTGTSPLGNPVMSPELAGSTRQTTMCQSTKQHNYLGHLVGIDRGHQHPRGVCMLRADGDYHSVFDGMRMASGTEVELQDGFKQTNIFTSVASRYLGTTKQDRATNVVTYARYTNRGGKWFLTPHELTIQDKQ